MTSRNKAIRKAFLDAYLFGHNHGRKGVEITDEWVRNQFEEWCDNNDHLLDGEPDMEQRVKELEQAWERRESYEQEQRGRG